MMAAKVMGVSSAMGSKQEEGKTRRGQQLLFSLHLPIYVADRLNSVRTYLLLDGEVAKNKG